MTAMAQDASSLARVVERTVRLERGRIVGGLLRWCGDLDASEEAFQEAALAAVEAWGNGVPENPGAWLMTAAKNHAKDARRRRAVAEANAPLLARDDAVAPETVDTVADDHLRLLFTCAHPALSVDSQIALTLKIVTGFSAAEIARAFVTTEATVSQRILRAKQTLEDAHVPYAVPERRELAPRLEAVIAVVMALYAEGHTATKGPVLRLDLQAEALRLARLLSDLLPTEPEVFGALAVIAFGVARASTRVDDDGVPILLADQDRARWDREMLREGLMALARARSLGGHGPHVLHAEIAAVHVVAPTWAETRWDAIVHRYDALLACTGSALVALNRAIAVAMLEGPQAGLGLLPEIERPLSGHHLFYAARAELTERAGGDPTRDLEQALALVTNDGERRLLERRRARAAGRGGEQARPR